jgi:hypothetical protein
MVINQAYSVNNTQSAEFYIKEFTEYMRVQGLLNGPVLSYQAFMNPRGYTLSMAFDSPLAYLMYANAESQFMNDTSVGQAHLQSSRILMTQIVGYRADWKYVINRTNQNYPGIPNLNMWGGVGVYGIVSGAASPISAGPKEMYVLVPVLDLIAAGMNLDKWGTANDDDWTMAYFAQGAAGISALLIWAASFLVGEGLLVLYSKLHILLEAACLGLVWNAESGNANTTTSATDISYAAGIFGIVGSIALSAADQFGSGI